MNFGLLFVAGALLFASFIVNSSGMLILQVLAAIATITFLVDAANAMRNSGQTE